MLQVPEVTDAEMAFGGGRNLPLPKWDDIPEIFRDSWASDSNPWCRIVSKWFFSGGSLAEYGLTAKPEVDQKKAMRAIKTCLGSFAPSHEHKIAGIGYMLSEWFDRAEPKQDAKRP